MDYRRIQARYSQILGISGAEFNSVVKQGYNDLNKEEFFINLLGLDSFDDVVFLLSEQDAIMKELGGKNEKLVPARSISNASPVFNEVSHEKYMEYIQVPVIPSPPGSLISTSAVDEKDVFDFEYFNAVQSEVFPSAYMSEHNFLVCAPTGCGKTNVAILCILNAFKKGHSVVYLAPMKALCTEVYRRFIKLFPGKMVAEYTGDIDDVNPGEFDLIVATPEKYDIYTRRFNQKYFNLIIIDEIHLLNEPRGAVLESVVCRMYRFSEILQEHIRIVGLSATLPNYLQVKDFIKAAKVYFFDQSYRPVPLQLTLFQIKQKSTKEFAGTDDASADLQVEHSTGKSKSEDLLKSDRKVMRDIFDKLIERHVCIDKVLVFVPSRNLTKRLSDEYRIRFKCTTGVHHAGINRADRIKTEDAFRKGRIDILFSTTTLAWGVNLPAKVVVIYGTTFYGDGGYQNYSILDIQQMLGRAGRPQYDREGVGYMITPINDYIRQFKNQKVIESHLFSRLADTMCAEIYLNNIYDYDSAFLWFRGSFLYNRMLSNPYYYCLSKTNNVLVNDLVSRSRYVSDIKEFLKLCIQRLEKCSLLQSCQINGNTLFVPTPLTRILAHYYLNNESIESLLSGLGGFCNKETLLTLIFSLPEFSSIKLNETECGDLHEYMIAENLEDKMQKPGCILSTIDKMLILFYTPAKHIKSFTLINDKVTMHKIFDRVLAAVTEICVIFNRKEISELIESIYDSKQSKNYKCYTDGGPWLYVQVTSTRNLYNISANLNVVKICESTCFVLCPTVGDIRINGEPVNFYPTSRLLSMKRHGSGVKFEIDPMGFFIYNGNIRLGQVDDVSLNERVHIMNTRVMTLFNDQKLLIVVSNKKLQDLTNSYFNIVMATRFGKIEASSKSISDYRDVNVLTIREFYRSKIEASHVVIFQGLRADIWGECDLYCLDKLRDFILGGIQRNIDQLYIILETNSIIDYIASVF